MPIYGFRCQAEKCGHTEEHYFPLRDNHPVVPCGKCGKTSQRDLTCEARNHIPGGAWPMTTTHLTGKPETFDNQASLNRRMKELGVVQRDDAAFVSKRYEGVNFKTGEQKYKESWSGNERGRTWFMFLLPVMDLFYGLL